MKDTPKKEVRALASLRPNYVTKTLFWFGLDKCQVPIKATLALSLLSWAGERRYGERLQGRDKDRERSLTSYCHGQNRLSLGRKGSLIHHQSHQSGTVRNKSRY